MKQQTFTPLNLFTRQFLTILVLLAAWTSQSANSQELSVYPQITASYVSQRIGPTDSKEVETLLDTFLVRRMKELNIPGAVFVLVRDGKILFTKGYGFGNLEKQTPVIPEKTIFRVGSVSKLFTATAVMQLSEKGLLNLTEDVNRYLKRFKMKETFPHPVTTAQLLTHSSGIGEYVYGQHTLNESEFQSLADYLSRRMPARVAPPGEIFMYSDHGMSLAGFLIEEITGGRFESYVEENILLPLGMERSTFKQPFPSTLRSDLATGYHYENGQNLPYQLDYCFTTPAATLFSTAADIARFMIAHLQNGRYENVRIMNEATAQDMHARHFALHPKMRGRAYGFSESDFVVDGERSIWHDGSMPGFNCRLILIPNQNVGFFVCWNSDNMRLKHELTKLFFDHYYPQTKDTSGIRAMTGSGDNLNRFRGYYRQNEGLSNTLLKLKYLGDMLAVTISDNNTLLVFGGKFVEVESSLFQETEDGSYIAFKEDARENIRTLIFGLGSFEKVYWYDTPVVQKCLMGFFIVVFLSACTIWPIGYFVGRKRPSSPFHKIFRYSRIITGLISGLNLVFIIGLMLVFIVVSDNYWIIMRGSYPWSVLQQLLILPLITTPLTIVALLFAIGAWRRKVWSVFSRLHYTLVVLTSLVYIWFLSYWNLFGFQF